MDGDQTGVVEGERREGKAEKRREVVREIILG